MRVSDINYHVELSLCADASVHISLNRMGISWGRLVVQNSSVRYSEYLVDIGMYDINGWLTRSTTAKGTRITKKAHWSWLTDSPFLTRLSSREGTTVWCIFVTSPCGLVIESFYAIPAERREDIRRFSAGYGTVLQASNRALAGPACTVECMREGLPFL
jgi:hypothetical protein